MFEDLLQAKTEQMARSVAAQLDVPLGASDSVLLARTVEHIVAVPDFAYLVVRDSRDRQGVSRGVLPSHLPFDMAEQHAEVRRCAGAAWRTSHAGGLARR